jgi:RNA polymerase sigma factor (sigma-70 family)
MTNTTDATNRSVTAAVALPQTSTLVKPQTNYYSVGRSVHEVKPEIGNPCHKRVHRYTLKVMTAEHFNGCTDEELIRAARHDPDAFDELFRRHAARLDQWFRARVPERDSAEDLVAETFAQALVACTRFRGVRPGSASSWLDGIAKNLLRQFYRRNRVETKGRNKLALLTTEAEPDAAQLHEEQAAVEHQAAELHRAISCLPSDQRTAVELRIIAGQSYDDVASALKCSNVAARMKVSRGLRALSARIGGVEA